MTSLPRAMTSTELTDIRTDAQSSLLYLAIHKPAQVYTALVNQTFTSDDKIIQITYDAGSGTLANVLPGMTLWVSALGYGQCELGQARIRKAPSGTVFYIGENSDIPWADDLYLTVMDEFGIWPRHIALDSSNVAYMDYDIAYSDQHVNCSPIPILGPRFVPVWLSGGSVSVPFDASLSSVIGSSISAYSWAAPGASGSSGMGTATPTISYNAAGLYRVACTLTAANGKTTTGYVYVQVLDYAALVAYEVSGTPSSNIPISQFDLKSCSGSRNQAGWQFDVTMYAQADFSYIVDRAMVCLFARDFYGSTEASIGPVSDRENIIAIGWIDGESIVEDPDGNSIDFTVKGLGLWMKNLTGFPIGIQNVTKTPTRWIDWQGLTVDASLYHLFYWQSTIIPAVDVFLTGDSRYSPEQYAPGDTTIANQMIYLLKNTILGDFASDRFNRLFCEIDTQLVPPANRSTIPSVLTLQYEDWREQMQITRIPRTVTSQVNLSGVLLNLPNTPKAYFSLAPGHTYLRWGAFKKQDKLLLSDQASSNQLAAMMLASDNHVLEFTIDLAGNNRMVDIIPHQFVSLVIASGDTPRGFTYNGHIIVRQVDVSFDRSSSVQDTNFLQISWQAENETFPGNGSNGDTPLSSTSALPPLPKMPPIPLAALPPLPTTPPSTVIQMVWNHVLGYFQIYYTLNANAADPTAVNWLLMDDGLLIADLRAAIALYVSPISGHCWLLIDGISSGTGNQLYYAPYVGGPWTVLVTSAYIQSLLGSAYSNCRIGSFGVNMGAPDEVMALMNSGELAGMGTDYWCPGNSGGFTKGSAANFPGASGDFWGPDIVYGNNQWTNIISMAIHAAYIQWCNRSGGSPNYNATATVINNAGDPTPIIRGGVDGQIFYGLLQNKANSSNNVIVSHDNGVTFDDLPTAIITSDLASSPDGQYLMAADNAGLNAKYSPDGGTTWSNIGIVGNYNVFYCYGGSKLWVMAGAYQVLYSLDGGATWTDITGDLTSWLPAGSGWFTVRTCLFAW